ncbi:hypothetical protein [Cellulomonas humilata]|uniref:hypothetical protein n=1 Tax=Cellulomonas humilata TaxID=144055 RepID=UPI001B3545BE|nr:hypothetical protein [Cellulomonas humilata]
MEPITSFERDRRVLARMIDAGEANETEVEAYEMVSDPAVRDLNRQQRSRAGQYLRRLRRRTRHT